MEAALLMSRTQMTMSENKNVIGQPMHVDSINDCKGVVYSYLSGKIPEEDANNAFRILSSSKVNKVCPIEFKQPLEVIIACHNIGAPSPSCCSSLNTYIVGIQKQMLITNKQAITCAMEFGFILRKGGVMTNVCELCDVNLKDFSIHGMKSCFSVILLVYLLVFFFYLSIIGFPSFSSFWTYSWALVILISLSALRENFCILFAFLE
ncbi:hypothetical protein SLE2022_095000 [Rubroshorea leprosula]